MPALVAAVRACDPSAEASLYALCLTYQPWVRSYLRDPEVSLDIIHTAFVVTLEAIRAGKIKQPEYLGSYIRRVVRRKTFSERFRGHYEELPDQISDTRAKTVLAVLIERERADGLAEALKHINQQHARALRLMFLDGQNAKAVRAIMGLTHQQLWNIKYRGLRELRVQLDAA